MNNPKECPNNTNVYISGPELEAAWRLMKDKQLNSISWAVRLLVRAGMKAINESASEMTPDSIEVE